MKKETKCKIGEVVGEVVLGLAVGVVTDNIVYPKCNNKIEKIAVTLGTGVGSWMLGRAWAKTYYKFCDEVFDTDFEDVIDAL